MFINHFADGFLNADEASEMVLSWRLAQDGGILSRDWFYSTELRVLNTQIVWSQLFKIFSDWHVVRVVGSIIHYLILLSSLFFFCKKTDLTRCFPLMGTLFLLPFSTIYFEIVLRGIYYIPHISISFLLIALMFSFRDSTGIPRFIWLSLASVLSFLAGLGGLRQLMIYYLPMLLTMAIFGYLNGGAGGWKKYSIYTVVSFLFAAAGCFLNMTVLCRIYFVGDVTNIIFTQFSGLKLLNVIKYWLYVLGFGRAGNAFDFVGIALSWVIVLLSIYSVVHILHYREKYDEKKQILAIFYLSAFVLCALLYTMTSQTHLDRYDIPFAVFAFPVIFACLGRKAEETEGSYSGLLKRKFALTVMMVLLFGASFIVYNNEAKSSAAKETGKIADALVSQGYFAGYATYWDANVLTELSDGKLDVWIWNSFPDQIDDVDEMSLWLQRVRHTTTHPEGKIFLLFFRGQEEKIFAGYSDKPDIVYQSEKYIAYGFSSYEEMKEKYR